MLIALRQWGAHCLYAPEELDVLLVDRKYGEPVGEWELRSSDGRLLGPEDLRLIGKDGSSDEFMNHCVRGVETKQGHSPIVADGGMPFVDYVKCRSWRLRISRSRH